jgi:hypothetical protein
LSLLGIVGIGGLRWRRRLIGGRVPGGIRSGSAGLKSLIFNGLEKRRQQTRGMSSLQLDYPSLHLAVLFQLFWVAILGRCRSQASTVLVR